MRKLRELRKFNPNKVELFEGSFFWGRRGARVYLISPLYISKRTNPISI